MTPEQSQRARVRIEEPQEDTSGRTGCLVIGAVLGIIAGVLFVLFGVGPLLNFLFPTETIAAGDAYHNDKLTLRVDSIAPAADDDSAYVIHLAVDAKSSWNLEESRFVVKFADGREVEANPAGPDGPLNRVPQGASTLSLTFPAGTAARPETLHLSEPPVKFELPEPATP